MMRAMVIEKYGKSSPLMLKERPIPTVGEHDVLVEIRAASLNPIDSKIKAGTMRMLLRYKMPLVLGNDFSGVVIKVGRKVRGFQPGDEVYGRPSKDRIGTLAEYIAVHEEELARKPAHLDFEEAASIPLVGLTAYQAFVDIANLQPGQKVLIHAGSGGVGTFAIQLAKALGAYVATTASSKGMALVRSLGADVVVDYQQEKFEQHLKDYDLVLDTLGGEVLQRSFQVLKPGGTLISISGIPDARFGKEAGLGWMKTALLGLVSRNLSRQACTTRTHYHFLFMKPSGVQLDMITQLLDTRRIIPIVDRRFTFEEAPAALTYLESGRAKGKVVVNIKS